ncbi:signal peptidase I [Hazenella coriacea]|uniref:signal peptidase I n=1 Tax=Hazenella coriacea TaxID=1179467 RepID=UPI001FB2FDE8|nr:signal peptidase I [Hazenella coriacea]
MGKRRIAFEWLVSIVLALIVAVITRTFFYAPYEVYGHSMEPTLHGSELLIVNQWIYRVHPPEYGDIIVFHTDQEIDFIKRVIGLPGDKIMIKNGKVYRNGVLLKESYLNEQMDDDQWFYQLVPTGEIFVMGDNRNHSSDSRVIGTIPISQIVGRADLILLPFERFQMIPYD